jgi:hypothetical protein
VSTPASDDSSGSRARLTARGILLALAAQVVILVWVVRSEITARVFISSWSLSMAGMLLLVGLRLLRSRRAPRPLSQAELLTAYVATSTTVMLVGYNFLQFLMPAMGTTFAFATGSNRWERLFPYIPTWLAPRDPDVLRGLFQGQASVPWEAWLVPLAAWGSLIFAVVIATLSLDVLLVQPWIRRERLAFPLAALPLEVSAPGNALFGNRTLWIGFAIPAVLESLLAINYYLPNVPAFTLKHQEIATELVEPPMAILKPIVMGITPFIVGLAFLAPTDVSFSVWFFYGVTKVERLLAFFYGWVDPSDLGARGEPHLDDQAVGAFLTLGALLVWRAVAMSRRREGDAATGRRGWTGERHRSERSGPRATGREGKTHSVAPSPDRPVALSVVAVCLAYVLLFFTAAGFPIGLSAVIIALYILTVLVIARVRAEAGFAWTYGPDRFASSLTHILVNVGGSASFAPRSLALLGFFHWLWWDLRFATMPAQLEALKIGDAIGMPRRSFAIFIAVATLIALFVGMYACLEDSYRFGWATAKTYGGPANGAKIGPTLASQWLDNPRLPDGARIVWMGVGGVVTLLLTAARAHFLWWPFHPLGYVMSGTITSQSFWFHYFVAWALKLLILRYGGMQLYRRVLPFVLGLILGDILIQALWSVAASLLDVPVYQFVS